MNLFVTSTSPALAAQSLCNIRQRTHRSPKIALDAAGEIGYTTGTIGGGRPMTPSFTFDYQDNATVYSRRPAGWPTWNYLEH